MGSMIPRYQAPDATALFGPEPRRNAWRSRSILNAMDMAVTFGLPQDVRAEISEADCTQERCDALEAEHGHEVVAFIAALTEGLSPDAAKCFHYGMTSSDLVEYSNAQAMLYHHRAMLGLLEMLHKRLTDSATTYRGIYRVGRTHGQVAEVTTLSHQFTVFRSAARGTMEAVRVAGFAMDANKSIGPVGMSLVRDSPYTHARPSTQILHRNNYLLWASGYLAIATLCESIAQFVRFGCRSDVGEFEEGAARTRVGSSAMAAKSNPIASENVVGLARLARAYHGALAEIPGSMWEDRDLSNSSTERVAIEDLAHTVETMVRRTRDLVDTLVVHQDRIKENLQDAGDLAFRNTLQALCQKHFGWGPREANAEIAEAMATARNNSNFYQYLHGPSWRKSGEDTDAAWSAFTSEYLKIMDGVYDE